MFDETRDVLQATVAKELIRKGRVTAAGAREGLTPRGDGRVTMIAGRRTPDAGRRTPDAGRRTPDAGRRTPDAGRREFVLRPGRGHEPTRRVTGPLPSAGLCA